MKNINLELIIIAFLLLFSRLSFSQQWNVVNSPSPSTAGNFLYGVYAVSENEAWAVGLYDTLILGLIYQKTLTEKWNGVSWNVISSPNPGLMYNNLIAVKGMSSSNVYAVGYSAGIAASPQMLVLHWNGTAWSTETTPAAAGSVLEGITIISSTNIWAVGNKTVGVPGPDVGTLIVHWNGSSWDTVSSPNVGDKQNFLTSAAAVSANDIWAVGYYHFISGPYQTLTMHWNGNSWNVVSSPNTGLESFLQSISVISSNDIWATGKYNNNGVYAPLFIHWNGTSWSIVSSPSGGLSTSLISSIEGWSVGYSIARWNGNIWSDVQSPIPVNGVLNSLSIGSAANMWAAGTYPLNGVSHTLIMHYGNLTVVKKESNSITSGFSLSQNYPNPFNPSTSINFSLPNASAVRLEVYDVTGKLIETLFNRNINAGTYNVKWNADNEAGGVYFYKLTAGSFTETKKMILLK